MIEKALLTDGKQFAKQKQIRVKRPSEYWLLFIKRYILTYKKPWFHLGYLFLLVPVIVLVIMSTTNADSEAIIFAAIFSFVFSIIAFAISSAFRKKAFVPLDVFHDLSKFIISIKGDVYRNLISLKLDSTAIEESKNALDPKKIGLKEAKGLRYKAFNLERFKASFKLKDGTVCVVSLHQMALRVITTKRRSSGKTKTKTKHKHKLFYQLILKLNATDYAVINPSQLQLISSEESGFAVTTTTEDGFHWIKVKSKVKLQHIVSKLSPQAKHKESTFTKMLHYVLLNKIIVNETSTKLIQ